jgi:hypothetical protein
MRRERWQVLAEHVRAAPEVEFSAAVKVAASSTVVKAVAREEVTYFKLLDSVNVAREMKRAVPTHMAGKAKTHVRV